ncbi:hypothetical protein NJ76_31255, partial [Rhodococcus sp. IITR03]
SPTAETRGSLPADLRVLDVSDVDGYSGDPLTDGERPALRPGNLATCSSPPVRRAGPRVSR